MMRSALRPLALLCLVAATTPSLAYADGAEDQAIARSLAGDGIDALKKGDFKTAEDRFRRAEQLLPDTPPTITLNLARALKGQNRFVAAQEAYNRVIRRGKRAGDPAAFEKAVDDATSEKDDIAKLIGSLTINVKGAEKPTVTLDGQPVNAATLGVRRPIDPGSHEIKVSAPGKLDAARTVKIAEAGSASIDIDLLTDPKSLAPVAVPPPPAADPAKPASLATTPTSTSGAPAPVAQKTTSPAPSAATKPLVDAPASRSIWSNGWFWTATGVGVAGVGLSVYAFSSAESIKSECTVNGRIVNKCANDKGYATMQNLNLAGYGLAGAGFATALAIALWPSGSSAPTTGYRILPVGGLDGTWGVRLDF